jgi:glycosyltransferase involved in cell wall biosynthesis
MALQGIEVDLVGVDGIEPASRVESDSGLRIHSVPAGRGGAVGVVAAVGAIGWRLARELPPDVVYLRPFPLDWVFLTRHLRQNRLPYVCELNTITGAQYRSIGQPLKGRLYERFDAVSIRNALAILPVTEEIGRWANRISGVRKPVLVAGNGVDVDLIPSPPPNARADVRVRLRVPLDALVLGMAGFGSPWHGFDRAISMLTHVGADVHLWLIGAMSAEVSARAIGMARDLGVGSRVHVLSRLEPDELAEVLAAVDIGIGPLALDRNTLTEAQPIKVRYYLASGLPVLYNYVDPKLDPTRPFLSYVPSTDPRELGAGVAKLRALGRDHADDVRLYAAENLSWSAIAAETSRFLKDILATAGR